MGIAKTYAPQIKAIAGVIDGVTVAVGQSETPNIKADAFMVDKLGIKRYLHVLPKQPQQLVWLCPQYGIDYTIEASTNLEWKIN